VADALRRVEGAFSMLFLTPRSSSRCAIRGASARSVSDLQGRLRLLVGAACLRPHRAEYVRDVEPGEMVVVDASGLSTLRPFESKPARCASSSTSTSRAGLEARRDRRLRSAQAPRPHARRRARRPGRRRDARAGQRRRRGPRLRRALRHPVRARPHPHHYVGRTFIEPSASIRHFGVRLKLSPVRACIAGKRVVVVDDSIVRAPRAARSQDAPRCGREGGAHAHLLATDALALLLRNRHAVEVRADRGEPHTGEIATYITSDTLATSASRAAPLDARRRLGDRSGFCDACFTGKYPVLQRPERERPAHRQAPADRRLLIRRAPAPPARRSAGLLPRSTPCVPPHRHCPRRAPLRRRRGGHAQDAGVPALPWCRAPAAQTESGSATPQTQRPRTQRPPGSSRRGPQRVSCGADAPDTARRRRRARSRAAARVTRGA